MDNKVFTDVAGRIARAITADAAAGHDETGGVVGSLTEAVMGLTAGLCRIADSLSDVAAAIREGKDRE